jgi:hypothetical protein
VICGFYEKLGFRAVGGNSRSFSILQNDTGTIGLFEGLFDKNILTFNPGWDRTCATLPDYDDVQRVAFACLPSEVPSDLVIVSTLVERWVQRLRDGRNSGREVVFAKVQDGPMV